MNTRGPSAPSLSSMAAPIASSRRACSGRGWAPGGKWPRRSLVMPRLSSAHGTSDPRLELPFPYLATNHHEREGRAMPIFKRDDVEIYYEEQGTGFPVLLIAPG